MVDEARLSRLSNDVAIVGIGSTDYADDYQRPKGAPPIEDRYGYAAQAFSRALADCNIDREEVDGLIVGPTLSSERAGEILGINPRWGGQEDAANAILQGALAIHSGAAECIALVYGNDQRSVGTKYGGPTARGDSFLSYVYYAPWGLTSQGALYAMMVRRYMETVGLSPEELAAVALSQRRFAELNPNAVMRKSLDLETYMAAPYICDPLRIYDYCLVNDGGVALILTSAERARSLAVSPVSIRGIGRCEINTDATSLWPRFMDFYHSGHSVASDQVYSMAGLGPTDVDVLGIYDSFTPHVVFALEGFGFVGQGDFGKLVQENALGPGGRIPVNTSGGHTSESYMQGWNHQVELVRQLRGQAGKRQVQEARIGQYLSDVGGKVISFIYEAMK
ncbi:thiolase family protein [Roseovarius pacificus]|uniref:thiolase family protein n=1 Tax=Roseovarius pacificus TaxID=337701 RepID=UPI002A18B7FF|nr:thiolase family protein [Roseovarius pacificus]